MKKICFHVIKYYPSLGGTELLAKQVIDHVSENTDYDITVLTSKDTDRQINNFNYKVNENLFLDRADAYDLSIFFSDLWSPQLNNYNLSNSHKNICILNLDEITYNSKHLFKNAIRNLKKFDLVLTYTKDGIANKFLLEENIKNTYIPNFSRDLLKINCHINIKDKLKLDNKKIGLYCAAFDKRKNQLYFLNTLKKFSNLNDYNWILIGNESDKDYQLECLRFCKHNHLKNVYFLSSTPDHNILNNIFSQIDFVVLLSTAEGTPLTLIESCSANKPFIFTPVGGSKGVFSDVINNGAYPLKNINYEPEDLLKNVLDSQKYNSDMLRTLWVKNHNKNNILHQYTDIIKNIML